MTRGLCTLLLLATACEKPSLPPPPSSPPPAAKSALNRLELLTESFVNSSFELSAALAQGRREVVDRWGGATLRELLEDFEEIRDLRLKVRRSRELSGETGIAGLLFMDARGTAPSGELLWLRVEAEFEAKYHHGVWTLSQLAPRTPNRSKAASPLFREVTDELALAPDPRGAAQLGLLAGRGIAGAMQFLRGVATADINGDGRLEIFLPGAFGAQLWKAQADASGTLRYAEVAAQFGLSALSASHDQGWAYFHAPVFFDMDNDGDSDLFVSGAREQRLFENRLYPEGIARFVDATSRLGPQPDGAWGTSVSLADINGDARPDIFVASYGPMIARLEDVITENSVIAAGDRKGSPNLLFVSTQEGGYAERAAAWGVAGSRWSLASLFTDFDGDGDPDLVVGNDFGGGTAYYRNDGDRFTEVAESLGLQRGMDMGLSAGDFDRDGDLDLHVTRMSSTAGARILERLDAAEQSGFAMLMHGNLLYAADGEGGFRNVTDTQGPFPAGWGWGGGFVDFDNDGWLDLYSPNGFISGRSMKDT